MYYFRNEPKWQKDLIKQLSKEMNLDTRVVRGMVYYSILYSRDRMKDDVNETPVRLRNLGAFTLKPTRSKKKNVTNV